MVVVRSAANKSPGGGEKKTTKVKTEDKKSTSAPVKGKGSAVKGSLAKTPSTRSGPPAKSSPNKKTAVKTSKDDAAGKPQTKATATSVPEVKEESDDAMDVVIENVTKNVPTVMIDLTDDADEQEEVPPAKKPEKEIPPKTVFPTKMSTPATKSSLAVAPVTVGRQAVVLRNISVADLSLKKVSAVQEMDRFSQATFHGFRGEDRKKGVMYMRLERQEEEKNALSALTKVTLSDQTVISATLIPEARPDKEDVFSTSLEDDDKGDQGDLTSVFINNIPPATRPGLLKIMFPMARNIQFPQDKDGNSQGYAVLEMGSLKAAMTLVKHHQRYVPTIGDYILRFHIVGEEIPDSESDDASEDTSLVEKKGTKKPEVDTKLAKDLAKPSKKDVPEKPNVKKEEKKSDDKSKGDKQRSTTRERSTDGTSRGRLSRGRSRSRHSGESRRDRSRSRERRGRSRQRFNRRKQKSPYRNLDRNKDVRTRQSPPKSQQGGRSGDISGVRNSRWDDPDNSSRPRNVPTGQKVNMQQQRGNVVHPSKPRGSITGLDAPIGAVPMRGMPNSMRPQGNPPAVPSMKGQEIEFIGQGNPRLAQSVPSARPGPLMTPTPMRNRGNQLMGQGNQGSHLFGQGNRMMGQPETTRLENKSSGQYGVATPRTEMGRSNHKVGQGTSGSQLMGQYNQMMGQINEMVGQGSQMMGQGNQIMGQRNLMMGQGNQMMGQGNHMMGQGNQMMGQRNQMMGQGNQMMGQGNQMMGQGNQLLGQGNQMFGQANQMMGQGSRMMGQSNQRRDERAEISYPLIGKTPDINQGSSLKGNAQISAQQRPHQPIDQGHNSQMTGIGGLMQPDQTSYGNQMRQGSQMGKLGMQKIGLGANSLFQDTLDSGRKEGLGFGRTPPVKDSSIAPPGVVIPVLANPLSATQGNTMLQSMRGRQPPINQQGNLQNFAPTEPKRLRVEDRGGFAQSVGEPRVMGRNQGQMLSPERPRKQPERHILDDDKSRHQQFERPDRRGPNRPEPRESFRLEHGQAGRDERRNVDREDSWKPAQDERRQHRTEPAAAGPDLAAIRNQLMSQLRQLETGSITDTSQLSDIAEKLKLVKEQQTKQQEQGSRLDGRGNRQSDRGSDRNSDDRRDRNREDRHNKSRDDKFGGRREHQYGKSGDDKHNRSQDDRYRRSGDDEIVRSRNDQRDREDRHGNRWDRKRDEPFSATPKDNRSLQPQAPGFETGMEKFGLLGPSFPGSTETQRPRMQPFMQTPANLDRGSVAGHTSGVYQPGSARYSDQANERLQQDGRNRSLYEEQRDSLRDDQTYTRGNQIGQQSATDYYRGFGHMGQTYSSEARPLQGLGDITQQTTCTLQTPNATKGILRNAGTHQTNVSRQPPWLSASTPMPLMSLSVAPMTGSAPAPVPAAIPAPVPPPALAPQTFSMERSKKIYVDNLPVTAKWDDIAKFFNWEMTKRQLTSPVSLHSPVAGVVQAPDRSYAYVMFNTADEADNAVRHLNGIRYEKNVISVKGSTFAR